MLCWSSQELRRGQVLGFFLDRSGSEKQRGSGPSLKTQHKTGKRWGPDGNCRPANGLGVCRDGPGRGEGVREGKQGQGPRKRPANCPGEGESHKVSIFRECLSF